MDNVWAPGPGQWIISPHYHHGLLSLSASLFLSPPANASSNNQAPYQETIRHGRRRQWGEKRWRRKTCWRRGRNCRLTKDWCWPIVRPLEGVGLLFLVDQKRGCWTRLNTVAFCCQLEGRVDLSAKGVLSQARYGCIVHWSETKKVSHG